MITLENISKSYSGNKALRNISLTIPRNSVTGILGPNGAGKSTLIKIITGFEFPDSGKVYIENLPVTNFKQRKNHISYLPEKLSIYPEYFVMEFLNFYHSAIESENGELLEILSLKKIFSKKIKHLSKGWYQRLKLYVALCSTKPIIVLDEPFEGFDPLQMRDIARLFKSEKAEKHLFLLSIHQLSYAEKICDYFVFLNEGKLVAEGSFERLSRRFSAASNNLEEIFVKVLEK